jgi:hypothetical protein
MPFSLAKPFLIDNFNFLLYQEGNHWLSQFMFIRSFFLSLLCCCCCFCSRSDAAPAYAQLSSLTTQVPTSGIPTNVRLDSIDALKNLELDATKEKIVIKESGIYLLLAAGQIGSTNQVTAGYVDFWYLKNGKSVPNSNGRMSVDPANATGVLMLQSVMELHAGDTLSIAYISSGASIGFVFTRPDNEPAIPSMVWTILKIDSIDTKASA